MHVTFVYDPHAYMQQLIARDGSPMLTQQFQFQANLSPTASAAPERKAPVHAHQSGSCSWACFRAYSWQDLFDHLKRAGWPSGRPVQPVLHCVNHIQPLSRRGARHQGTWWPRLCPWPHTAPAVTNNPHPQPSTPCTVAQVGVHCA